MNKRLSLFAAALWWGSLTALGFMVVPMLFAHLPTLSMAGQMAAKLFAAQTWVSVVCGVLLLVLNRPGGKSPADQHNVALMVFILLGLLLALLVEYAVAPRIVARENLRLWHTSGSVMYGVQWLCAAVVLWRMAGSTTQEQP
ncbi:DUF4149 domain-containing protein [Ottowia caeni]|uniref:DUF4149 domain-containing protein n=1 Tax=Ottowia caeni TaxID=2870339 RepID=UPI001E5DF675|nr:DUF4149 domain-containing protein [Ottowia caeni]